MFYSLVCEIRSQDLERSVRTITVKARDGGEASCGLIEAEVSALALEYRRESFFEEKFKRLSYEDDLNVVRYALKKIHDGLYREFCGLSVEGADAGSHEFASAEVEHIWPKVDADALSTESDSGLAHRIGNLLLLSRPINASGGSKQADLKMRKLYPQEDSKYLIARCLVERPSTTGNHAHARGISRCPTGFSAWGPDAVSRLSDEYLVLIDRYLPPPGSNEMTDVEPN